MRRRETPEQFLARKRRKQAKGLVVTARLHITRAIAHAVLGELDEARTLGRAASRELKHALQLSARA